MNGSMSIATEELKELLHDEEEDDKMKMIR